MSKFETSDFTSDESILEDSVGEATFCRQIGGNSTQLFHRPSEGRKTSSDEEEEEDVIVVGKKKQQARILSSSSDDDQDSTLPPPVRDLSHQLHNLSVSLESRSPESKSQSKKERKKSSTAKREFSTGGTPQEKVRESLEVEEISSDDEEGAVSLIKKTPEEKSKRDLVVGVQDDWGTPRSDTRHYRQSIVNLSSTDEETDTTDEHFSVIPPSDDDRSNLSSELKKQILTGFVPFIPKPGVPAGVNNRSLLENEKRKLEASVKETTLEINNLHLTMKNIRLSTLPDGGEKLKITLKRKERELATLKNKLATMDTMMDELQPTATTSASFEGKKDMWSAIPTANVKLSEMGQRALETHRVQSTLTMDKLKGLHRALETRPGEQEEAEDPTGLKVTLLPHQRKALAWLIWRENNNPSGGILADDMGLGKTMTMISLILKAKEDKTPREEEDDSSDENDQRRKTRIRGGTLVVCPSSVMGQWENELKSKVVRGLLASVLHHGPKRDAKPHRLAVYDVVVTSYSILQKEIKENKLGPLLLIRWDRVILDEAHVIRNYKCKTAQAAFLIKAVSRWTLTGTPVHNKELDFYSLLKFLRFRPFDDLQVWRRWVDNKDAAGASRLECITRSILLRRTKQDLLAAGELSSLAVKRSTILNVTLDKEEWELYKKIAHFSSTLLGQLIHQKAEKEDLLQHGIPTHSKQYAFQLQKENPFKDHPELAKLHRNMMAMGNVKSSDMLVLLLRLRQICCHPSLVSAILDQEELFGEGLVDSGGLNVDFTEAMGRMSLVPKHDDDQEEEDINSEILTNKNPVFVRSRISSKMRAVVECLRDIVMKTDDKAVVVSQWTSVLEILAEVLRKERISYVFLTGKVPVPERGAIVEKFNDNPMGQKVMLLSLTAGGTGLNLIGGNHLLLIDVHWNPQLEEQASDRIYRVGQKKQVFIYKFICSDTIEERIVKLQEKKRMIAEGVLAGKVLPSSKLTMEDLKLLFAV